MYWGIRTRPPSLQCPMLHHHDPQKTQNHYAIPQTTSGENDPKQCCLPNFLSMLYSVLCRTNRGQTYVPTPLSSDTPMFLQPMFLRPYVPTPLCSDTPMFRHPYTPTNPCEPCSYTLMFLHPYVPTPLCSYSPICRQSVVCPVLGNNFQNFHRNRSWATND